MAQIDVMKELALKLKGKYPDDDEVELLATLAESEEEDQERQEEIVDAIIESEESVSDEPPVEVNVATDSGEGSATNAENDAIVNPDAPPNEQIAEVIDQPAHTVNEIAEEVISSDDDVPPDTSHAWFRPRWGKGAR